MRPAPVVLFVYNRPQHTLRTLEALSANELAGDSRLIIYADGPKPAALAGDIEKIRLTREIIRSKQWLGTVEIKEAETNRGLAQSVIGGVTEAVNEYGRVIVLEDDLITANGFLKYMNAGLEKYEGEEKVMQVSGYLFPVKVKAPANSSFFLPFTTSWGWATWKRAWNCFDSKAAGYEHLKKDKNISHQFDLMGAFPYTTMLIQQMEGTGIDSWAIRWWWSVYKRQGITLFPGQSLVHNIGFDRDATHTSDAGNILNSMTFNREGNIESFPAEIAFDNEIFLSIRHFLKMHFSAKRPSFERRDFIFRIKNILTRTRK